MNKRNFMLLLGVVTLAGCSKQEATVTKTEKPGVYTVNYPLAYFAERIAGDEIDVHFPEAESDPAFWTPTTDQIIAYQNADLILLNGAGYAKWVQQVSLPPAKLIDTSVLFKDQYIPINGAAAHAHGGGEKHAHGDIAFTTWLDPQLAILQAEAIHRTFSSRWPLHNEGFDAGFNALKKDLQELDERLASAFSGYGNNPITGSHPVYQYLARHYALNLKSVHWEPDTLPDEVMVRELDDLLEAHPAKSMLWEGEPLSETELMLQKKGIQTIVFDPCGNRPDEGDYLSVMNQNLKNLEQ